MPEPKGHHQDNANLHGGHHMSFGDLFGLNQCFGWTSPPSHPHHQHPNQHPNFIHDGGSSSNVSTLNHVTEDPVERPSTHRELAQPNHKPHPQDEREIHVLEMRPHDHQVRHHFVVPDCHGDRDRLGIRLVGREFTIKLPDDVRAGEHITVIAPV